MFKKLFVLPVAFAAAVAFASPAIACGDKVCGECEVKPAAAAPKPVKGEVVHTTYKVSGLKCQKCVNAVNTKLGAVEGVSIAKTDLAKAQVVVSHAKGQAAMPKLQAALGDHFVLAAAAAPSTSKPAEDCCAEGEKCEDEKKPTSKK